MTATINKYLSLVKFSHTVFALPFAFIGFFLGWADSLAYNPSFQLKFWWLAGMIACMIFARSAAMAFNRYLDRDIDALNPRTKSREIPANVITPQSALAFVILNCVLFCVTTWFINPLVFYLSPIALIVVLGYSYTKRFTAFCHFVLGLGLSLAPIGSYLCITERFSFLPVLFSITVFCWVSGFDIIYALQDEQFDKDNQLHSVPSLLGAKNALMVSRVTHVMCMLALMMTGVFGEFSWLFWIGYVFFIAMLFSQHRVVRPNDLSRVNLAFFTYNGLASIVFGLLVVFDILIFRIW